MNFRFWRNVALIGGAHVAVIVGLIRWSAESKTAVSQNVTWLGGASGSGASAPKPASISTPPPHDTIKEEREEDAAVLTPTKSEIQLPSATPKPTPRSTSTPKPAPEVKVPPKRTPPPKPKPTPKPSPKKLILAKASPKPKPTPEKEDVDLAKEEKKEAPTPNESPKSVAASTSKGTSAGNGGHGGGATIQAQFGWYGSMLHDRFYSEWAQPTNVDDASAKSVLAKLRIERDGRVTSFEVVRPSGSAAIDDSVRAAAKRVTNVEPLPPGLGGDHYDVKIKFELSSD